MIDEQYCKENQRMNKLKVRLIGAQAIFLAQYSNRLIYSINLDQESGADLIWPIFLGERVRNKRGKTKVLLV